MAQNYYWNRGCTFPITKQDVIDGRCYLFLEAIRKFCFLRLFPASGYYYGDTPCTTVIGENHGDLLVYDGINIIGWDEDEKKYSSTPYNDYLNILYGTNSQTFKKGCFRVWCDGIIWASALTTQYATSTSFYSKFVDNPPIRGGWFASDTAFWNKSPNRNKYYEWDFNSLRNIWDGDIANEDTMFAEFFNIGGSAYLWCPKQFDPYEQQRPLYKLPIDYLYGGDLLVWTDKVEPIINKYYYYDKKHLWKCLKDKTTETPSFSSSDWQYVNLLPTSNRVDFKFLAAEVEIRKNYFFKEDIQGAQYDTDKALSTSFKHPGQSFTQYTQITGVPASAAGSWSTGTYQEPKICETISAYIEAMFDYHRLSAEVDYVYRTNYHTHCGGIYGIGTEYASYDKAVEAGVVSLFAPITDIFWGCNGSGFEWSLKKIGSWDWYFDTEYPQYFILAGWMSNSSFQHTEAQAAFNEVLASIKGTWRRTWKHSIGIPKEALNIVDGSLTSTCDSFIPAPSVGDEGVYANWAAWVAAAKAHFVTADVTVGNTTGRHKPTQEYQYNGETVRDWDITQLTDFINELWNILSVKTGTVTTVSTKILTAGINTQESMMPRGAAQKQVNDFLATYKTRYYSEGGAVSYGHRGSDITTAEPGFDVHMSILRMTIQLPAIDGNVSNVASYKFPIKYWTSASSEITAVTPSTPYIGGVAPIDYFHGRPSPSVHGCSLVKLEGSIPLGASASPRRWNADPIVYHTSTISVSAPEKGVSRKLVSYFKSNHPDVGLSVKEYEDVVVEGTPIRYYLTAFALGLGYSYSHNLAISTIRDEVLIEYDFNLIKEAVWHRDGNFPVLTNTFELPILPPYPNPPYWVVPPKLISGYINELSEVYAKTISGNIGNCTSAPSGRVTQYMFRMRTAFELVSEDIDKYDYDKEYDTPDIVNFRGYIYKAREGVYPNEYPGSFNDIEYNLWEKLYADMSWANMLLDKTDYEYVDDNDGRHYIQLIDVVQDEVHYALPLTDDAATIQNLVFFQNFAAWVVQAKAYESDVVEYSDGKECLWGSKEIAIDEGLGLDLGVLVTRKRQTSGEPPAYIDAYDITPIWVWNGNTADNDEFITENKSLTTLCQLHKYEPTSLVWDNWTKTVVYTTSNLEDVTGLVITPDNYDQWLGVKIRATVTLSVGDVTHNFISGWALIIPVSGLEFNE